MYAIVAGMCLHRVPGGITFEFGTVTIVFRGSGGYKPAWVFTFTICHFPRVRFPRYTAHADWVILVGPFHLAL